MLWTIIIILVVIWLISVLAGGLADDQPYGGNWIHTLVVVAVILVILHLLGIL